MVSIIQPEGERLREPDKIFGKAFSGTQESSQLFGSSEECFQEPACFVIAASGRVADPGTASPPPPPPAPRRGRRNRRSEKTALFSERAGLLDSVRFFRTDLGKTRWSSRRPAKPNRTSPCKVNPEIYINKYSSGP